MDLKKSVKQHWEDETCGTRYGDEICANRYKLEPYIHEFADFAGGKNKKVLEIGVGAGCDFLHWVNAGAIATGIDLTESAIKETQKRLEHFPPQRDTAMAAANYLPTGQAGKLLSADAENLPFPDNEFDIVYSWGVLHHTPDTFRAFSEAFRILKSGGTLKAMIYHIPSWTGALLWIQHCLLKGKFWRGIKWAIFHHLESPGTKAYTIKSAREMLSKIGYKNIHLKTKLCAGDLLTIKPSKKYQSAIYKIIWKLYPRFLVKLLGDRWGLNLLITATKH